MERVSSHESGERMVVVVVVGGAPLLCLGVDGINELWRIRMLDVSRCDEARQMTRPQLHISLIVSLLSLLSYLFGTNVGFFFLHCAIVMNAFGLKTYVCVGLR